MESLDHLSVIGPGFSTFNQLPGGASAAGPQVTLGGAQASGAYATQPIDLKPENTELFLCVFMCILSMSSGPERSLQQP